MRAGSRGRISPLMVGVVAATVFALAGSAGAASGGSAAGDGTVQACVATKDIVHRLTDGIDKATGELTSPVSALANTVVGGVNQDTGGAVSDVTSGIIPAGSVLIVASGTPCPADYAPETLAAVTPPATVDVGQNTGSVALAKAKVPVAFADVTTAGPYLVTATADIAETGVSEVAQTVKCALVDGTGMQTIADTTSTGTFPAHSSGMHLTETIDTYVADVPVGEIGIDCKDPELAATATRAGQITATGPAVSPATCIINGGNPYDGVCMRGQFDGRPIKSTPKPPPNPTKPPAKPPKPPTATGSIRATSGAAVSETYEIPASACIKEGGRVMDGRCFGGKLAGGTVV
jgi:hypothetical protein